MVKKNLLILLGISLVTQATTSLISGLIGIGPFTDTVNTKAAMNFIIDKLGVIYSSVYLQIITALVIVVLGTALYYAGSQINKIAATIAMGFYMVEAMLVIIEQILIFAITEASRQYVISGDIMQTTLVKLLFALKDFCGAIAMIPFGIGAIIFYYLIMKAHVIPKWLGLWGLITVPIILIGWSLEAFGVAVPFALYIPYVPWEWIAGIYIITKSKSITSRINSASVIKQ